MSAPKENLMSLGNLTDTDRNTFTTQRQHSLKHRPMLLQADFSTPQSRQHLRVMHLQRRWQELKERECSAQQHNRQLLQQFDRAQDALRELLARNSAMKTVRMEYEKYLEESAPHWQQQLKEKTAQRKRMEEYLRSCLKNSEEEQMRKSSAEQLLQGLKPQKCSALQENKQSSRSDNNQEVCTHLPCQSSWLTHTQPQSARFPTSMPHQPQGSSLVPSSLLLPPSILPHSHQFQHLTPTLAHHPLWPRQDQPDWASPQCDNPWTTGAARFPSAFEALWGQLHMDEPPHERLVEAETRRAPGEMGGEKRSSHCPQELDINPVRLSSGQAESSESGRDSGQSSREKWKKREKRGKTKRMSSDRESCSSQEVTVVQSSESDASSGKRRTSGGERTKRSGGLAVGSPQIEKMGNDTTKSEGDSESHKEQSHSTGEESGSQSADSRSEDTENLSPVEKSDREEEPESDSVKIENGDAEKEMQESNSGAEQDSEEETDEEEEEHKNDLGDGGEKSQRDEEKDVRHVDDDDEDSGRKNTTEEEETGADDELEDQGDDEERFNDEDGEKRKQGSASSQGEEEDERVDNKVWEGEEGSDEEEEGEEEEEQRSDEAGEEESDSDDSIISPQENRLKKIHIIPEEAAEDDDNDKSGSKTGSSDGDEFSEDDIENLLAPQEQTKKIGKDPKDDDKTKATCDYVEIFQVDNSTKTDQQSDSDEFDHFYD
ncbi:protein starmaker isoform X2 [Paralichthys olivaceus]|uniref:protein starmaker isoform X2 n=1 Tax=Paralichthys olivaceus TaxID=8255 RepID=UPI003751F3E5